jgi:hypothetical protein
MNPIMGAGIIDATAPMTASNWHYNGTIASFRSSIPPCKTLYGRLVNSLYFSVLFESDGDTAFLASKLV